MVIMQEIDILVLTIKGLTESNNTHRLLCVWIWTGHGRICVYIREVEWLGGGRPGK